ncbi:MAG TPA: Ni/Fe hydrogenase subunit alpha [Candidatus Binataceae bacterium]|nr:Ni/Fe hydrogenase subunit alpha [Candidatus Binataceae bacterium]
MKTIKVDYLARVEGEGAVRIRFRGDQVRDVAVRIFEPPRFFEAFLRGRSWTEVTDITARICGICPVAYQMSSCAAMEDAVEIDAGPVIAALRRLFYCGEWIESHTLHMFFLHAPDFLGYPDAITMAREHREIVLAALAIKKAGNAIVRAVGGREVHPINPRVGGFHSLPPRSALRELITELERGRQSALEAIEWMGRLNYPDYECDYEFVAVDAGGEYPFIGNRIVSNQGLDIPVRDYERYFEEYQVQHSNALHSRLRQRGTYLCGPLARFNLHFDKLSAAAREAARRVNLEPPCLNPFKSIMVRGVETAFALEEAIRIIESYEGVGDAFVPVHPASSIGHGASEAPRGMLYHRYRIDDGGIIREATIVPPTSQNLASMEHDLTRLAPRMIAMTHPDATHLAEQTVRNYDPCISCATHFLKLTLERE